MQLEQDTRYALRQLCRAPGFALTAVLTLALGVGATTAIFSVVDAVLLRPLPFPQPDRIVAIETLFTDRQFQSLRLPGSDYQDVASQPVFAATAYYESYEAGVQLGNHAAFTQLAVVSPAFLDVLGIRPVQGTLFAPRDAAHQALVSASFADAEMGGAKAAIGKQVGMEGVAYQVVGVMPRDFDFPQKTNVWLGAPATPGSLSRDAYNYHAVARVRDSFDVPQAQLRLDALSKRLAQQVPVSHAHVQLRAIPLRDALTGQVRTSLWLWLAAVGVLLMIACVNVAHLQLVRVSAQAQALAVRAALGATRSRIVTGILLETAWIAMLGAAVGALLSLPATRLLSHVLASQLPRPLHASIDLRLLGFCVVLTAAITALSGALPCWWGGRRDPAAALNRGTRTNSADRSTAGWRRTLLMIEVALSFLLLSTSGLLLRTLQHIHAVTLGFAADNRLVVYTHAPARDLEQAQKREVELAQLTDALGRLPGVTSATQIMGLPAGQYGSNGSYAIPAQGRNMGQAGLPHAVFSLAGPGYFEAMRIPVARGRSVTPSDTYGSQPVAVISAALARQSFGVADPLGERIICGLDEESMRGATIVGVVGDVRQDSPADDPSPALYMPLAQHPYLANEVEIVLHTATAPAALIPAVHARVLAADPSIAVKFTTMDDALERVMQPQQLRGRLLTAFAAIALLLAAVGVYGVISYSVAQQVREIGIRMALGADRATVSRHVMQGALRSSGAGILLGCLLSVMSTRAVAGFLVGVRAIDPVTYLFAAAVLISAAAFAALLPARRAASTEPMSALRAE